MDIDSVVPEYPQDAVDSRLAAEEAAMAARQLEPISEREVTETEVNLHINFEIRFEGVDDETARTEKFEPAKAALFAGIREYWNHTIGEQSVTWTNQIASKEEDADASTDSPVRYKRNAVLPPPPTRDEGESIDDHVARAVRDIRLIAHPTVNSDMARVAFVGRKFQIIPTVTWLPASAPSDPTRAWLYSIRSSASAPLVFEGESLEGAETRDIQNKGKISKTLVERGAVSMAPEHATNPLTYAHEMLHLFGLIDRYGYIPITGTKFAVRAERLSENLTEEGKPRVTTAGRLDPLGLEPGPVLDEDSMYVLNGTGVYEAEISRGLDDIARMDELRGREMSTREIQQEIDIRAERERR